MDGRRPDAQPLLRFATVPEAPVYRAIIEVFTAAATGYNGRLSPEDVRAALVAAAADEPDVDPPSVDEVADRLARLTSWGNLSADHDSSRAASLDAYGRTAYVL